MHTASREKYSSAITMSDMEIFIFPELMFSLVLANIMSPCIWNWLDDPWFKGIADMQPYRRITRLKQYIMDHYDFNLDLDTWGLTNTDTELARFEGIMDKETLRQSNALFGYEGDKYYFDMDIRTHFGLDKYEGDVIPYWKTETVEAMDAFQYKENYRVGAGECVSLAALYAAALYVVAQIPLEDIFLMATPLHSQNFVMVNDGILTNNRRLVTKNMWFNGTALSAQARRALENEQVTIVSHVSGCIHAVYDEATIPPETYQRFADELGAYVKTGLTCEILGNFMRQAPDDQKCFQLRCDRNGVPCYIPLEKAFAYENGSPYRITDNTRTKLLQDIEREEFQCSPLPRRIVLNDLEVFINEHPIDIDTPEDVSRLEAQFDCDCLDASLALRDLIRFCHIQPRLPQASEKTFCRTDAFIDLPVGLSRKEIQQRLQAIRGSNPTADLAFYAYRDLGSIAYGPYLQACMERNPVCVEATANKPLAIIEQEIRACTPQSIYEGNGRLSQPDEVWNFRRGDGAEQAILLANILHARNGKTIQLDWQESQVVLTEDSTTQYTFATSKQVSQGSWQYPLPPPDQS